MKTKAASKTDPMERIQEDLYRLGFCGGEMNSTKTKREFLFTLVKRSPLVPVLTRNKKTGEVTSRRAMRLRAEPDVELVIQVSGGVVKWSYDTAAQDRESKRNGLHSKLALILGRS